MDVIVFERGGGELGLPAPTFAAPAEAELGPGPKARLEGGRGGGLGADGDEGRDERKEGREGGRE